MNQQLSFVARVGIDPLKAGKGSGEGSRYAPHFMELGQGGAFSF